MAKSKYTIAFLIDYLNSEYSAFVLNGIKAACKQFDMDLLVFPIAELNNITGGYNYQYVAVTALLTHANIDGIVFPAGTQMRYLSRRELLEYLKTYDGMPIVSIGCDLPGIPSVIVDCTQAYKSLINYLIDEQGCRKFGLMGVRNKSIEAQVRSENILNVLQERNISSDSVYRWSANFDFESAYAELEHYYKEHKSLDFDVILCLNDEMLFATEAFCRNIGKRIPQDILVAGFDNIERDSFSQPSMTSIDQSILDQGYEAVKTIKAILDTGKVPEMRCVESVVYCRESTNRNPDAKRIESDYLRFDITGTQVSSKYTATEWYLKKFQLYQITSFYTDMQMDITNTELRNRINGDFRSFGIKSAAIVLYDKPVIQNVPFEQFVLPEKAYVFSAFDNELCYDSSKINKVVRFNPNKEMIPEGLIKKTCDGTFVRAIFHGEIQYGYFLFSPGEYDIAIYDMLSQIISSIIDTLVSYREVKKERTSLINRYSQLDKEACSDELTGLNNRRGLYNFGQALLDVGKAMEQTGLIIFGDMDGLKKINDTFGHAEGDRAIIAEAKILKNNFRSNDVIGRIGGDEFALVCPGLTIDVFEKIKAKVTEDCKEWSKDNNVDFELSISLGFTKYPSKKWGYQMKQLLAEADMLLYKEKREKRKKNSQ